MTPEKTYCELREKDKQIFLEIRDFTIELQKKLIAEYMEKGPLHRQLNDNTDPRIKLNSLCLVSTSILVREIQ